MAIHRLQLAMQGTLLKKLGAGMHDKQAMRPPPLT
jgi:hypothetical protein